MDKVPAEKASKKKSAKRRPAKAGTAKKKTPRKRTKKAKPRPDPRAEGLEGVEVCEGVMHFGPGDLLKFNMAQLKVENANRGLRLKQAEVPEARRQFEATMQRLEVECQEAQLQGEREFQELLGLKERIEKVYGIDLKTHTYDDESGRIFHHGEPIPA